MLAVAWSRDRGLRSRGPFFNTPQSCRIRDAKTASGDRIIVPYDPAVIRSLKTVDGDLTSADGTCRRCSLTAWSTSASFRLPAHPRSVPRLFPEEAVPAPCRLRLSRTNRLSTGLRRRPDRESENGPIAAGAVDARWRRGGRRGFQIVSELRMLRRSVYKGCLGGGLADRGTSGRSRAGSQPSLRPGSVSGHRIV